MQSGPTIPNRLHFAEKHLRSTQAFAETAFPSHQNRPNWLAPWLEEVRRCADIVCEQRQNPEIDGSGCDNFRWHLTCMKVWARIVRVCSPAFRESMVRHLSDKALLNLSSLALSLRKSELNSAFLAIEEQRNALCALSDKGRIGG